MSFFFTSIIHASITGLWYEKDWHTQQVEKTHYQTRAPSKNNTSLHRPLIGRFLFVNVQRPNIRNTGGEGSFI